jgi:NitT/TauT family transport system ATP-binding protein
MWRTNNLENQLPDITLSLDGVSHSYHTLQGETPALHDISLHVKKGEFIAIVGPSGCGKSTLLSLISGLAMPDFGTIRLPADGQVGYMFQKDNLLEWRTVYRNATLGLEIKRKHMPAMHISTENTLPVPKDDLYKKADALLKAYGLWDFRNVRPSQLSGGMRQRAALIRTLALEPNLLLLDEPFSALDYQTRLQVCDDVSSIIKNEGKTAILVTHDISEAISMADRVVVLSSRPATIRDIIDIKFSLPMRTPFLCRNAPEFKDYFNLIWTELTADAGATA